jgi:hypothetical protein
MFTLHKKISTSGLFLFFLIFAFLLTNTPRNSIASNKEKATIGPLAQTPAVESDNLLFYILQRKTLGSTIPMMNLIQSEFQKNISQGQINIQVKGLIPLTSVQSAISRILNLTPATLYAGLMAIVEKRIPENANEVVRELAAVFGNADPQKIKSSFTSVYTFQELLLDRQLILYRALEMKKNNGGIETVLNQYGDTIHLGAGKTTTKEDLKTTLQIMINISPPADLYAILMGIVGGNIKPDTNDLVKILSNVFLGMSQQDVQEVFNKFYKASELIQSPTTPTQGPTLPTPPPIVAPATQSQPADRQDLLELILKGKADGKDIQKILSDIRIQFQSSISKIPGGEEINLKDKDTSISMKTIATVISTILNKDVEVINEVLNKLALPDGIREPQRTIAAQTGVYPGDVSKLSAIFGGIIPQKK